MAAQPTHGRIASAAAKPFNYRACAEAAPERQSALLQEQVDRFLELHHSGGANDALVSWAEAILRQDFIRTYAVASTKRLEQLLEDQQNSSQTLAVTLLAAESGHIRLLTALLHCCPSYISEVARSAIPQNLKKVLNLLAAVCSQASAFPAEAVSDLVANTMTFFKFFASSLEKNGSGSIMETSMLNAVAAFSDCAKINRFALTPCWAFCARVVCEDRSRVAHEVLATICGPALKNVLSRSHQAYASPGPGPVNAAKHDLSDLTPDDLDEVDSNAIAALDVNELDVSTESEVNDDSGESAPDDALSDARGATLKGYETSASAVRSDVPSTIPAIPLLTRHRPAIESSMELVVAIKLIGCMAYDVDQRKGSIVHTFMRDARMTLLDSKHDGLRSSFAHNRSRSTVFQRLRDAGVCDGLAYVLENVHDNHFVLSATLRTMANVWFNTGNEDASRAFAGKLGLSDTTASPQLRQIVLSLLQNGVCAPEVTASTADLLCNLAFGNRAFQTHFENSGIAEALAVGFVISADDHAQERCLAAFVSCIWSTGTPLASCIRDSNLRSKFLAKLRIAARSRGMLKLCTVLVCREQPVATAVPCSREDSVEPELMWGRFNESVMSDANLQVANYWLSCAGLSSAGLLEADPGAGVWKTTDSDVKALVLLLSLALERATYLWTNGAHFLANLFCPFVLHYWLGTQLHAFERQDLTAETLSTKVCQFDQLCYGGLEPAFAWSLLMAPHRTVGYAGGDASTVLLGTKVPSFVASLAKERMVTSLGIIHTPETLVDTTRSASPTPVLLAAHESDPALQTSMPADEGLDTVLACCTSVLAEPMLRDVARILRYEFSGSGAADTTVVDLAYMVDCVAETILNVSAEIAGAYGCMAGGRKQETSGARSGGSSSTSNTSSVQPGNTIYVRKEAVDSLCDGNDNALDAYDGIKKCLEVAPTEKLLFWSTTDNVMGRLKGPALFLLRTFGRESCYYADKAIVLYHDLKNAVRAAASAAPTDMRSAVRESQLLKPAVVIFKVNEESLKKYTPWYEFAPPYQPTDGADVPTVWQKVTFNILRPAMALDDDGELMSEMNDQKWISGPQRGRGGNTCKPGREGNTCKPGLEGNDGVLQMCVRDLQVIAYLQTSVQTFISIPKISRTERKSGYHPG